MASPRVSPGRPVGDGPRRTVGCGRSPDQRRAAGVLPLAVLTGFGAFLVGSGPVAVVVGLHAVVGFAIVLLLPWKSMIARRGLRHRRPGQATSIMLAVLVLVALLTGLAHSTGLLVDIDGYGVLLIHVGAGLAGDRARGAAYPPRRRIRPRTHRREPPDGAPRRAAARPRRVGVYLAVEGWPARCRCRAHRGGHRFVRAVLRGPGRGARDVLVVRRRSGHRRRGRGGWRCGGRGRRTTWSMADIDATTTR